MTTLKRLFLIIIASAIVASVLFVLTQTFTPEIEDYFANNKIGSSPDYAFMKIGLMGEEQHLITIHGYVDDKSVCEWLANYQNQADAQNTQEASVFKGHYYCKALNN